MKITFVELINLLQEKEAYIHEDANGENLVLVEDDMGALEEVEEILDRVEYQDSPDKDLVKFFEEGYYVDYYSEWYCDSCNKYHRVDDLNTVEDGYSSVCTSCLMSEPYEYLNDFINNYNKAYPSIPYQLLDSEFMGEYNEKAFTLLDNLYACGLYEGRNARPEEVFKRLKTVLGCEDVVFAIESSSMFETEYRVLIR